MDMHEDCNKHGPDFSQDAPRPVEALITQRHREIMRHALGLSQSGREYRNRYVPGGKDVDDCEQLAELGLMEKHEVEWIPDPFFTATEAGKEIARAG